MPFQAPGTVRLRRLSRFEYDNTIRDLLDDTTAPARGFVADSAAFGFDNLGDAQTIAPVLVEQWALAAERSVSVALAAPPAPIDARYEAEAIDALNDWGLDVGRTGVDPNALYFIEDGWCATPLLDLPAGRYAIEVVGRAELVGLTDPAEVIVRIGGREVARFELDGGSDQTVSAIVDVERAYDQMEVGFTNWQYAPEAYRRLFLDRFSIRGPLDPIPENPTRSRLLASCDDDRAACAEAVIRAFGRRAFRRPLAAIELEGLLELYRQGLPEGEAIAIGAALQALLLSPSFLFRVEADAPGVHALDDHALAIRLAFFLWSTTPDDALLDAADAGTLRRDLDRQLARMLADPKARALTDSFLGQWLGTRALREEPIQRDASRFPDFDPALQASMAEETERFFVDQLQGRRPLSSLLRSEVSFVDARLAAHYGVPAPSEPFAPVSLASVGRSGGLLTQAGVLTLTALPSRTSIVRRGKWILDNLLCLSPPPPPPGVEGFPPTIDPGATLRERMEMHRSNPSCMGCHQTMDPLGFALEEYDAIGRHRALDENGLPVDVAAALPDGRSFVGAASLAQVLADDPQVQRCVAQKLATYAIGRGFTARDRCDLEALLETSDGSLRGLIETLIASPLFQSTQGAE